MMNDTNKCFYDGNIQITMNQDDQSEILSSRKFSQNSNALMLDGDANATRLIIDRVEIG